MKKVLPPLLILFVAGLTLAVWWGWRVASRPYKRSPGPVMVTVHSGDPVGRIAAQLEQAGMVVDQRIFRLVYRLTSRGRMLKAGTYRFDAPMTVHQLIDWLAEGRVVPLQVTIPEGLTIEETAIEVAKVLDITRDEFLRASRNTELIRDLDPEARNLEGYLFPDTYQVERETSAGALVTMMVRRFRIEFNNEWLWRGRDLGWTVRQVVTLASLIEKETALRDERFRVSSVFHNRLRADMLLDCDSTIVYALKRENRYRGRLGWDDLKIDSPYNTRTHHGLPPGPIGSPGAASLEAALYPETTDYYYFVAQDDHSHRFSRTLQEHNRAVRRFIIRGEVHRAR